MPAQLVETTHHGYQISSNRSLIDIEAVHAYISQQSYWAPGRPREVQQRAVDHSHLVMGAYLDGAQVGFGRMITDLTTWGYLSDVYVLPEHQGTGLGTALVRALVEHPDVAKLRWQFLATDDAHGLYERFGFTALHNPGRLMERSGGDQLS